MSKETTITFIGEDFSIPTTVRLFDHKTDGACILCSDCLSEMFGMSVIKALSDNVNPLDFQDVCIAASDLYVCKGCVGKHSTMEISLVDSILAMESDANTFAKGVIT